MTTKEERLAELLDAKDQEIEALRDRVEKLEWQLDGSRLGWSNPREEEDRFPNLPLPRLELEWTSDGRGSKCEYRLVSRHLCGQVTINPLGVTTSSGRRCERIRRGEFDPTDLPFRDGAHAHHDAAHLDLPLYIVADGSFARLDGGDYFHQRSKGLNHRRAESEVGHG